MPAESTSTVEGNFTIVRRHSWGSNMDHVEFLVCCNTCGEWWSSEWDDGPCDLAHDRAECYRLDYNAAHCAAALTSLAGRPCRARWNGDVYEFVFANEPLYLDDEPF